jgi:cytochrome c-type biogenesis protein CcmF
MALLFIGVAASSAFQHTRDVQLRPGQSARIGNGYVVKYERATARIDTSRDDVERIVLGARMQLSKDGKVVGELSPSRGYYPLSGAEAASPVGRYFNGEATSEVAMRGGLRRDVWMAITPDISRLTAQVKRQDAAVIGGLRQLVAKDPNIMLDPRVRASLGQLIGSEIRQLTASYAKAAPPATFRLIVSPMVAWIWLGGLLVILGGIICIWPTPDLAHRRATAGYAARVARDLGRA